MPFDSLAERVADVRARCAEAVLRGGHGQTVTIIAVTKTHGPEAVRAAWEAGLRDVGENKVQEALGKQEVTADLPLRWHLIGHLQRNKVKALASFACVHAVDSARLADAIDAWARAAGRTCPVLMQVNVSGEATKGGFAPHEVEAEAERWRGLSGLRVDGVMTMAPFDADEATLRRCFAGARAARDRLRAAGHPAAELSMGMSQDYEVAVEEGATLVRLGTTLFGARH
jgi:pyridoxal phosphate enzyme (YggS family)